MQHVEYSVEYSRLICYTSRSWQPDTDCYVRMTTSVPHLTLADGASDYIGQVDANCGWPGVLSTVRLMLRHVSVAFD